MATREGGLKPKISSSKYVNFPSTSTTSSSRHNPEASVDNPNSHASSAKSKQQHIFSESLPPDSSRLKENVTVTVRFRSLSPKEIRQGEEIAWYADGETIVRNEHTPAIAYAYDRVFGPTTTTRHVYDVAAQHVVSGAMEGINGTIFAYGVTSSGKTHTMHGDQRSPGIIPLAVKDAFDIIQETPRREFLLRLSYLEIYNEVVNDLLNPAGQRLRIKEDRQGTFVEGIKEEIVLSPAHALSIIAAGEEHRHVGSTNFNLLSSRSHTIFTLTIESSPCGENNEGETVNLSQLNLIDLAGSESSKAETTGLRRKEGSYINKSLLTLGTVISKLTDGRAAHIPYRDSKLTRLLQSSLSGHGRVSLICTVTPSSSNSEETLNTLKFAHRAKHIEIQAAQNKIIDEKSLIKTYQNEIRSLMDELEQLKRDTVIVPQLKPTGGNDIVILKQKLEVGEAKLQSRLDQDEQAKDALLSQIQKLTKLILVSTKSSHASRLSHHPAPRRKYSFGEEELAYLPHRRHDLVLDDENVELYVTPDENVETSNCALKEDKKIKKRGLLNWLKPRKRDSISGALTSTSDKSSGARSMSTSSTPRTDNHILPIESRNSHSSPTECTSVGFLSEANKDTFLQQETPVTPLSVSELEAQLNEKSFELEVKATDNRTTKEQLDKKKIECEELQEIITALKQQLYDTRVHSQHYSEAKDLRGELHTKTENTSINNTENLLLQQTQALEIEQLKQKVTELTESKQHLEAQNKKLAEESSYAKELASEAAVELKALSKEVTKLMNHNDRLSTELASHNNSPMGRRTTGPSKNGPKRQSPAQFELKKELALSRERETAYEAVIFQKDQRESELERMVEESKQRETHLENELANMWILVAKLKKSQGADTYVSELSRENPGADDLEIWDGI